MKPPPALVRLWYRKLAASGFDDIEAEDGRLRAADEQRQADAEASWRDRDAVEVYFRTALAFLHTPTFRSMTPTRRRAWALHAQGRSNQQIARELRVTVKVVRVAIQAGRKAAGLPATTHTLHG